MSLPVANPTVFGATSAEAFRCTIRHMSGSQSLEELLHNLLTDSDLSFRDFVELALYHPVYGYYSTERDPVGKEADYVTAPRLSPVFSYALEQLTTEFLRRAGDGVSSLVDAGCGSGELIQAIAASPAVAAAGAAVFGVDRNLGRASKGGSALYTRSIGEVPRNDRQLVISNELFDAIPFARLVQRGEELHELWVTEHEGQIDWTEHEAPAAYGDYFAARNLELVDGQFADVSLEWEELYRDLCSFVTSGLLVTFDYGFRQKQLFDPRIRRFGTAASYSQQRVTRDLLAQPGRQDLTAHINFDDLILTGESLGFATLFFGSQAKFLLSIGITSHPLFTPVTELPGMALEEGVELLQAREDARRLVLPDGIGEEIRVLVQGRGVELEGWSFQRTLF